MNSQDFVELGLELGKVVYFSFSD